MTVAARRGPASNPAEHAAKPIHDAPASITREWLQELESDGLPLEEYVEILGIVARLRAPDTTLFGLGHHLRPLPEAEPGEPSYDRRTDRRASHSPIQRVTTAGRRRPRPRCAPR